MSKIPAETLRKIPVLTCTLATLAASFFLLVACSQTAQAQTFNVLYAFGAGGDGASPWAGVTLDRNGNIYGTTVEAGHGNAGTVYELKNHNGTWLLTALHEFLPANGDGAYPLSRVVFGPDGRLYGTTSGGGASGYWGTVYTLSPPVTFCRSVQCYWDETIIYSFNGTQGGGDPGWADPVFDRSGNLYGTAQQGGQDAFGVVYELTRSGGTWTESVLHSFSIPEGISPAGSVTFDHAGNIWGTTTSGEQGSAYGSIFELSPSGSGWTSNIVHLFQGGPNDGASSYSGLTVDASGNIYGTTAFGGHNGSGAAFQLTASGGGWNYGLGYTGFTGGTGPWGTMVMDAAGNFYGTSLFAGAHGYGAVFKLTPSNGGWTYTSLHDFTGGNDGQHPYGGVTFDANGNLYGTAADGGRYGRGVVWEIVP